MSRLAAPTDPLRDLALADDWPPPGTLGSIDAGRLATITLDFGNTLVPVPAASLRTVVERTAAWAGERWPEIGAERFAAIWREERERQLAEDVPQMREADLDRRAVRILARVREAPLPEPGARWDDTAIAHLADPAEVGELLRVYGDAFLASVPAPPAIGPALEALAGRWSLGVVSNWPLAEIVERYIELAGWRRHLRAVVVSQAVGWIKPDRRIFEAAARELGVDRPAAILHVGDDLGADVAGPHALGWQAAWLRTRPPDSPLPEAGIPAGVRPDAVFDSLPELADALLAAALAPAPGAGGSAA